MSKSRSRNGVAVRWSTLVGDEPAGAPTPPFTLGVIPGEGIGPEVIGAALKVLSALKASDRGQFEIRAGGAVGRQAEPEQGTLTEDTAGFFDQIFARGGAILTGPAEGRFVYDLRRRFDLFCKIVPLRVCSELAAQNRLKPEFVRGVDVVLLRENSSGLYQGKWSIEDTDEGRRATHSFAYSEAEVSRIVRVAARIAASRQGRLLVIVKDGGAPAISEIWRDCAVAATRALGVQCFFANIDLAAYLLIQNARDLDVIVAPNLFGDVLADLGAVLLGSRGLSFSGNFSSRGAAVYQTNHGAALDMAGTDQANPVGQILSLAMLLHESFGLVREAALIEEAVAQVWRAGWRTQDVAAPEHRVVGCREMGNLVAGALARLLTDERVPA
jgi:3-isopropylmalate dehydrogenase